MIEIAKGLIDPIATVVLAWVVGHRLAAVWAMRQKRREETRAAANEFYRLYGEFFAVWKLWNYSVGMIWVANRAPNSVRAPDQTW